MEKIYKKRLTSSEAKRHYIYLESDAITKIFPPIGKPFKLKIGKEEFKVKIGDYFKINATEFKDYIDFREGNVLVFKKAPDGSFTLNTTEISYRRKLRPTEAKRHYITISKEYRDVFPPSGEIFKIIVNNENIDVTIDKSNRIWAALFWDRLPHFEEGDTIVFSKNPDDSFNVSMEK